MSRLHIGYDPALGPDKTAVIAVTARHAVHHPVMQQLSSKTGVAKMIADAWRAEHEVMPSSSLPNDFVQSFLRAVKELPREVDMSVVVDDPRRFYSPVIRDWIFGPHGEFTGFAKTRALIADLERQAMRHGEGHEFLWSPRAAYIDAVSFNVKVVYAPLDRMYLQPHQLLAWSAMQGIDVARPTLFVRFETYADYALWEEIAAHDTFSPRQPRR